MCITLMANRPVCVPLLVRRFVVAGFSARDAGRGELPPPTHRSPTRGPVILVILRPPPGGLRDQLHLDPDPSGFRHFRDVHNCECPDGDAA
jgi:hypothetical protein